MDRYAVTISITACVEVEDIQEIQAMVDDQSILEGKDIVVNEISSVFRQDKETKIFEEVTDELE